MTVVYYYQVFEVSAQVSEIFDKVAAVFQHRVLTVQAV
jgi:hypothetical protein